MRENTVAPSLSPMKPTMAEHSTTGQTPFSTVVYEQSMSDRHETGPDGEPHLLPRETLHHVYLQDDVTKQLFQLGIAATAAIGKQIVTGIRRQRLPAVLLSHGDLRYAAWSDSIFPAPEAALPEASGNPLAPVVYEWSPPDVHVTGDNGQPIRLQPRTFYNLWVSDPDRNLRGFLCTVTTRATARAMASSLENGRLPVALRGSGQECCAVWTAPLSTSPLARPALGSC